MDEIVSAASILAGAKGSGWLADKLLGPSAGALGEQIRLFAGKRLSEIFSRAEKNIVKDGLETLPPGFAINFVQKSSFSEDDPVITDMWAGLLSEAAHGVSSKHNLFIEILSQIGGDEARFLNKMFQVDTAYPLVLNMPSDLRSTLSESVKRCIDWSKCQSKHDARTVLDRIKAFPFDWPTDVRFVETYWSPDNITGKTEWLHDIRDVQDSLITDSLTRQRLIDRFEIDFSPGWASPRMHGFFMTSLGVHFVRTCRTAGIVQ